MSIPEFLQDLPSDWRLVESKVARLADDQPPFGASYNDLLEDFITVHSDRLQLGLEVDWLPERSPSGQFILSAIDFSAPERLTEMYAHPRRTFTTRSLHRVIAEVRAWMLEFTHDHMADK